MADWFDDLEDLHDRVWSVLERGVAERDAPARHPVLATAGLKGGAEARVVVLRAAARVDAVLEVHTDTATAKIGELARDPMATLLVWDSETRLQIRVRSRVEIMKGAGAAQVWQRVPQGARGVYGVVPLPGQEIDTPDAFEPGANADRFAVLTARAQAIDVVYLGEKEHRRALYLADDNWHGSWRAP
ncbi:MAG: pyridoxamine 5'-phosphate oxidase family protein [Paracoccaceae bacterium]